MRDAKASSAGSTLGQGSRPGFDSRAFTTCGASVGPNGSGAPSIWGKALFLGSACLLAAFCLMSLFATAALSDSRFGFNELPSTNKGIAVSAKEGGDIYISSTGNQQRVNQYQPNGTFVRAFGWGIVPGGATGAGNVTAGSNLVTNVTTSSGSFNSGGGFFNGGQLLSEKIVTGAGIPPGTKIQTVKPTELVLTKQATTSGIGVILTAAAGPGNVPTNEQQRLRSALPPAISL